MVSTNAMRTPRQRAAELKRLAAKPDAEIDTSDIPERASWSTAEIGKFYRPVKQQVTLRLDPDVLAWFKSRGSKYQTALNQALREHMRREAKKKAG